ncbi:ribokinase [Tuberibacillus sp. Marseille-P3662]|uniref:ribokinase n=1 Tax=Tuberibacillus sp. Marseille-P3662 TaxID=1965358 RepID=UPI000A1CE59C|nr:ribokinase [Tuberibacillus sp. Marseille-P3662]
MKNTPKIAVVGSLNMDLVTQIPVIPARGETQFGDHFSTNPGGKGANQAVACARLGADVSMIGCVGQDDFGKQLLTNLKNEGINADNVEPVTEKTGIATIIVEENDNRIIVTPGANHALTPEMVDQASDAIQAADVLLVQLETPLETVKAAMKTAKQHDVPVILNPAPAVGLGPDVIQDATFLTPNEHELATMLGRSDVDHDFKTALQSYPGKIIMTKGSEGAYYSTFNGELKHQPAVPVEAVDATGAGDTYNAGLAVTIGQGKPLEDAVQFATYAGTLSVAKHGAQDGMPYREEVDKLVKASQKD